ncbi:MAG: DNA recombination protein RmuC [Thermaerobacter sp.]|nr:DNA recombination protein RmuC [Thermaerobacter sp.]
MAVLLGLAVLALAGILALVLRRERQTAGDLSSLRRAQEQLLGSVNQLSTKVVEAAGGVESALRRDLGEARELMVDLRARHDAQREREEELGRSVGRIAAVLAGSKSRGTAGENILGEALQQLPPGMVERDFRVHGKPVEYALVLPDGRRLAIDSKWPRADLLEQLEHADATERDELAAEVERGIGRKAQEAAQYIDPETTLSLAVAAVPDAAFALARGAHARAFRQHVLLMPYSMALPVVLAIYTLQLQLGRTVDLERLSGYLRRWERDLDELDQVLENKLARGLTMVQNAQVDLRRLTGDLRAAIDYLEALPATAACREASEGQETGGD